MNMMAEVSGLPESRRAKKPRKEVDSEETGDATCADLHANRPVLEEPENGLLLGKANTAESVEIPDIEEQESLEPSVILSPSTPEPLREGASG
jgi:hypothetical protein